MLVKTSDVRLKSVYVRAYELGYSQAVATDILKLIGSFKTVEKYMGWRNNLKGDMKYMVERVGANNYRKMRDIVVGLKM